MKRDDRAIVSISSEQVDTETLRKALIDDMDFVEVQLDDEIRDPVTVAVALTFVMMNLPTIMETMESADKAIKYIKPLLRKKLQDFLKDGEDKDDGPGKSPITFNININLPGFGPESHSETIQLDESNMRD